VKYRNILSKQSRLLANDPTAATAPVLEQSEVPTEVVYRCQLCVAVSCVSLSAVCCCQLCVVLLSVVCHNARDGTTFLLKGSEKRCLLAKKSRAAVRMQLTVPSEAMMCKPKGSDKLSPETEEFGVLFAI
jgi:hypothetical protein